MQRNHVVRWSRIALIMATSLFLMNASQAGDPQHSVCEQPAYRAFDLWIGDWDVYEVKQPHKFTALAKVERILAGGVIHELYDAVARTGNPGLISSSARIISRAPPLVLRSSQRGSGIGIVVDIQGSVTG